MEHQLRPGTLLNGRYRIERIIGQGGFGITYEAVDVILNIKTAVKELYIREYMGRDVERSPEVYPLEVQYGVYVERAKKDFLKEARILGSFKDEPAIARVLDYFQDNETAYIIMDFLEGTTLARYLQGRGTIPAAEIFRRTNPLMKALQRIHASGVIHRDISPDNIIVAADGEFRLIDFGSARNYVEQDQLSRIVKEGYAPIEQWSSKLDQGPWTDIYALSATVYKCITGAAPDNSVMRKFYDELKKPSELGIYIDESLENILWKGLAVEPEERYQSMGELQEAIGKVLKNPRAECQGVKPDNFEWKARADGLKRGEESHADKEELNQESESDISRRELGRGTEPDFPEQEVLGEELCQELDIRPKQNEPDDTEKRTLPKRKGRIARMGCAMGLLLAAAGVIFLKKDRLQGMEVYEVTASGDEGEILQLFSEYYRAVDQKDTETLARLGGELSEEEKQEIERFDSVERHQDIRVFTTEEWNENLRVCYVKYYEKILGTDTLLPCLEVHCLKNADGQMFIVKENNDAVVKYITQMDESESVIDLYIGIGEEREETAKDDPILLGYLSYTDGEAELTDVQVTGQNVRVRETPMTGEILTKYQSGTGLKKIAEVEDGWTMVSYENGVAYISSQYLRESENTNVIQSGGSKQSGSTGSPAAGSSSKTGSVKKKKESTISSVPDEGEEDGKNQNGVQETEGLSGDGAGSGTPSADGSGADENQNGDTSIDGSTGSQGVNTDGDSQNQGANTDGGSQNGGADTDSDSQNGGTNTGSSSENQSLNAGSGSQNQGGEANVDSQSPVGNTGSSPAASGSSGTDSKPTVSASGVSVSGQDSAGDAGNMR